jgi:hypothetical protein
MLRGKRKRDLGKGKANNEFEGHLHHLSVT